MTTEPLFSNETSSAVALKYGTFNAPREDIETTTMYEALLGDTPAINSPTGAPHKTSNAAAVFHLVCVMAGTGIVQLPYCIRQGGWFSVGWIILAAVVSHYTGCQLIQSLYAVQGVRLASFSDAAGAAYGTRGRIVTRIFKDVSSIGTCTLFLILAGYNLNALLTPQGGLLGVKGWIIASMVVVTIPYVAMKTIQDAVVMSVFGALTTGLMVVIVVALGLLDLPNHTQHDYQWMDAWGFPIALSSICYSFGGNVVWPQVEHGLRDPKVWPRALGIATALVSVMYVVVAVVGYAVYDAGTLSPIFINLPGGTALTVANVMVTTHVLLTTPIMMSSVSSEFESDLEAKYQLGAPYSSFLMRAVVRVPLMVLTMLIAAFVPYFADVMALLGSLVFAMLIFVLPVMIHGKLFGWHNQSWSTYAWNILIIAIGGVCCVVGSYQAILALIRDFQSDA
ncbi:hypothetical protein IWQ61_004881 [Dispira simplex]|nr:hypothetical protein IWQ61_004881 [Dispira simplex]